MSFTPKPFGKNNPCPICDRQDGSCRYNPQEQDFIFCHTYADAHEKEVINGYICVKQSNGHTASFKPDTGGWSEEAKREWQTKQLLEQQLREKRRQAQEKQRKEKAMSAGDRHKYYLEILDELTLSRESQADLQRRGFTREEIERSGFKSVKPNQKLNGRYPDNLPGIKGNRLQISHDGYLQPIRNHQGLIIGLQIRLHNPEDGNKHRWLSCQENPVHTKEFGELPLAVFIPQKLQSFDIQIVEGTGAKPFLAEETRGMVTIGASGGNHTSSPETLKATIAAVHGALQQIIKEKGWTPELPVLVPIKTKLRKSKELVTGEEAIVIEPQPATIDNSYLLTQLRQSLDLEKLESKKVKFVSINIVPDAGFALNPHVIKSLVKTTSWLEENFKHIPIFFSDWNQIHKSQADIDELKLKHLSVVRTLKADSFFKKYKEVINIEKGFGNKRFQDWAANRVKLTTDTVQYEKWLSIPKDIHKECDILLIRKYLGGGKTQALIEFLKTIAITCPHIVSLLVGYRNTLLRNTINRAVKLDLNSMHIKDAIESIGKNIVNCAADDSIKLWGGCADSFFKFNAVTNHNPDYFLIHDEICSVLAHLKGGGTLKGRQQEAIEWITNTIQNSKFALMMDANLSDKDVAFIRELFPNKRIKVLDSISPIVPREFYFLETECSNKDYSRNPRYLPSQLVDVAKKHQRVLWLSDSQRSCEIIDEILTESGDKHFRLDGKTSHGEVAESFQSNPVEFIKTEKLDSVSISPSGESGLSIDLYNYFDCVCFDIRGTVSVNTLTQLSARLRDTDVPIYVSCPEFVNVTSDPCPYAMRQIGEILNQRIDTLLAQAISADGKLVDSQFVMDMFAEMGQKFANNPWFIESLKDTKDLKYEHSNLKLTLKTALVQAGHRVIDQVDVLDEGVYKEVQETKEKVKWREAEKIFNSPDDMTWEQAQEASKKDVDYDTKCRINKAWLKHLLPGIEDTASWNAELVYAILIDEPQFLEKRWRLKQLENEELSKAIFKVEKRSNFEFGFAATDIWKSSSTKIEALKMLGVEKIIQSGQFSSQDEWIQEIVNEYYREDSGYFELIGISKAKQVFNNDGSLKNLTHVKLMVDRFLDYFGLECEQATTNRGSRRYAIAPSAVLEKFPDVDECLRTRAKAVIELAGTISLKEAADKAEEKKQLSNNVPNNTKKTEGCSVPISSYNKPRECCTPTKYQPDEIERWKQSESIAEVAEMLDFCEDAETLALIRLQSIPSEVFKVASRSLHPEKREQIRQWVVAQNAA